MNSSILSCFELALAKTLVDSGLIKKEDLARNYRMLRGKVANYSALTIGEKEILDFLEEKDTLYNGYLYEPESKEKKDGIPKES